MVEEEIDSIRPFEQLKYIIKEAGQVHQGLCEHLGIFAEEINQKTQKVEKSKEIYHFLKDKFITTNKCKFREFLKTISHLWKTHQSKKGLNYKIESLFNVLKEDIKNTFSEKEIFDIFHFYENNFILLILLEQNILSVETMIQNINLKIKGDWKIIKYFYPEIRKYNEKYFYELMIKDDEYKLKQFVEENDQNLEFFYEIRKKGTKEPKLIELIREDRIDEFISFVEFFSIDLNEKIQKKKTIYEINRKILTPVEYSALFGSITIFKYFFMNEVNINAIVKKKKNHIVEYAVDGRNYEIIHLLEARKEIMEELNNLENQQKFLKEPIKMYHNEIFEYFLTNYNFQVTAEVINLIIKYRNYELLDQLIERNQIDLKNTAILDNIFTCICKNGNEEILKILIKQPNLDINSKDNIFQH